MNAAVSAQPAARGRSPFDPRVVLGLLLVGALAFIAALYFIGAGDLGSDRNDGGAHAASSGLTGYAALGKLLEARGDEIGLVRSPVELEDRALLVLTPPAYADPEEIREIISDRRYRGPTLVVLPKWSAMRVPPGLVEDAGKGWVVLAGTQQAGWAKDLLGDDTMDVQIEEQAGAQPGWRGLGLSGSFADPEAVQTMTSGQLVGLASDRAGQILAGYWDDGGDYPALDRSAGITRDRRAARPFGDTWPVVIVADPDLMNNYGMADQDRAALALALVDAARGRADLPIAFDLTLNGLGATTNLLTLAFTPPFLAATLCLIIAAIVVAWRAFRRFGPPIAETAPIAFGKRQLAVNGAGLIQRARRLHLLGSPYAALMRARLARLLGVRGGGDADHTEAEIGRLLEARGIAGFQERIEAMRQARGPQELLRSAHALKQIERTLER